MTEGNAGGSGAGGVVGERRVRDILGEDPEVVLAEKRYEVIQE